MLEIWPMQRDGEQEETNADMQADVDEIAE